MNFVISGKVSETSSGLPIPRVLVVAYDKKKLFDVLLGAAETEEDGTFSIQYDYRRPARAKYNNQGPDLYVAVFAPPCLRLVDTASRIRYNAFAKETFHLSVDPNTLADVSLRDADIDFSDDLADAFEWEVG